MSRGVGQKSGRAQALDPLPPHSQSFFLPERNFRPVGGHADNRFEKSSNDCAYNCGDKTNNRLIAEINFMSLKTFNDFSDINILNNYF